MLIEDTRERKCLFRTEKLKTALSLRKVDIGCFFLKKEGNMYDPFTFINRPQRKGIIIKNDQLSSQGLMLVYSPIVEEDHIAVPDMRNG